MDDDKLDAFFNKKSKHSHRVFVVFDLRLMIEAYKLYMFLPSCMTFSTLAHEKKRRSEAFRLGLLVEIVDGAAQSQRVTMFHLHLDCFILDPSSAMEH